MEFRLLTNELFAIIELSSESQLDAEGARMHHCVGQYADRCRDEYCSIWSLREYKDKQWKSRVTIEVRQNYIAQMAGPYNGRPERQDRELIRRWLEKNGIGWNY